MLIAVYHTVFHRYVHLFAQTKFLISYHVSMPQQSQNQSSSAILLTLLNVTAILSPQTPFLFQPPMTQGKYASLTVSVYS